MRTLDEAAHRQLAGGGCIQAEIALFDGACGGLGGGLGGGFGGGFAGDLDAFLLLGGEDLLDLLDALNERLLHGEFTLGADFLQGGEESFFGGGFGGLFGGLLPGGGEGLEAGLLFVGDGETALEVEGGELLALLVGDLEDGGAGGVIEDSLGGGEHLFLARGEQLADGEVTEGGGAIAGSGGGPFQGAELNEDGVVLQCDCALGLAGLGLLFLFGFAGQGGFGGFAVVVFPAPDEGAAAGNGNDDEEDRQIKRSRFGGRGGGIELLSHVG